jgi:RNA polymerase sigma-70 factor (ECF subfamily)
VERAVKGLRARCHQQDVTLPALAAAAQDQEEGARPVPTLSQLFAAHAQDVARWARRLGGPLVDVEDVVQEVFLVAHRRLPTFRGEASSATWLFRITRNVARHRRRKDRLRGWLTGAAERLADGLPEPSASAPEQLIVHQRHQRLHRVLGRLGERDRTVLVLFELESLSGEEIAQMMNARVGTVWVWLHRARAAFLKRMRELEAEEGE